MFLPGESQGRGSPVGCRLWGHTESDTTEATQQQQQQQGTEKMGSYCSVYRVSVGDDENGLSTDSGNLHMPVYLM